MLALFVNIIIKYNKGRKIFGIGSFFSAIVFSGALIAGVLIGIDDINKTNIAEGLIQKAFSKYKKDESEFANNTEIIKSTEPKTNDSYSAQSNDKKSKTSTDTLKEQNNNKVNLDDKKSNSKSQSKTENAEAKQVSSNNDKEKAESFPLDIDNITLERRDNSWHVNFDAKNTTNKVIDAYGFSVITFDNFDRPVINEVMGVNLYNFLNQSYDIEPNIIYKKEGAIIYNNLISKVKVVLKEVHFKDGTSWSNPNWKEYIKSQKDKY